MNEIKAVRPRGKFNREALYWLKTWQGWLSIAALFGMLFFPALSLTEANWVTPQPAFLPMMVAAIGAGMALAVLRIPALVAHLAGLVLGAGVVTAQALLLQPYKDLGERGASFVQALRAWWAASSAGEASPGTIQVALLLCVAVWLIGYLSGWYLLRKQNAWVAISTGAGGLLINLSMLRQSSYEYFTYFTVAALVLAVTASYSGVLAWFGSRKLHSSRLIIKGYVPIILCLMAALASTAWVTPQIEVAALKGATSRDMPWTKTLNAALYNFFIKVPAQRPAVRYADMEELWLRGGSVLGEDVVCVIQTETPGYWWTKKYDVYTAQGWKASDGVFTNLGTGEGEDAEAPAHRSELTYSVITRIYTEIPLIQGELASISVPVRLETLPSDGVVGIATVKTLKPNQKYRVTVYVPQVNEQELAGAGEDYPGWVTGRYLQLPDDFPDRVAELARELTAGLATPYEKIAAIKQYLADIPYSRVYDPPPPFEDAIENFLFSSRTGDCNYFASAMAVMLRAVGVPARLNSGYVASDWNEAAEGYNIRASGAHIWPEIYFPGYGWIPVEATPSAAFEEQVVTVVVPVVVISAGYPEPAATEPEPEPTASGPVSTAPPTTTYAEPTLTSDPGPVVVTQPGVNTGPYPAWVNPAAQGVSSVLEYFMAQGFTEEQLRALIDMYLQQGYSEGELFWLIENDLSSSYSPPVFPQATATPAVTAANAGITPQSTVVLPPGGAPGRGGMGYAWGTLVLTAGLIMFGLVYRRNSASFRSGTVANIYARVCLLASLGGLGLQPQQTALEHASRLSAELPRCAPEIDVIIRAYVRAQYGRRKAADEPAAAKLRQSWQVVRKALLKRLLGAKNPALKD